MKRPEYVAAAVTACKKAMQGKLDADLSAKLKAVFSRSGFTNGYLEGNLGKDMFGTRVKEDVTAAASVLGELARLYDKEKQIVPIKMKYTQRADASVSLECVDDDRNRVAAYGKTPEKALNKPTDAERAKNSLLKLGSTPFYAEKIELDVDETLMVSVSEINALRRQCTDKLIELREHFTEPECATVPVVFPKLLNIKIPNLRARFKNAGQIPAESVDALEYIYLPADEIINNFNYLEPFKQKLIAELPRAMFGVEKKLTETLKKVKELGVDKMSALNLAHIETGKQLGFELHGGFSLNCTNSMALQALAEMGVKDTELSVETDLLHGKRLGDFMPYGIIAYGRLPLMLTRNCPLKNTRGCQKCGGKGAVMFDRLGNGFYVMCSGGAASEIYNCKTLYLADRLNELEGFCFINLMFTLEDKSEVSRIINEYQKGGKAPDEFTRGLYYRGVL